MLSVPIYENNRSFLFCLSSPLTYAWEGGVRLSENPEFTSMCMSREEYEEQGVRGALTKFEIWTEYNKQAVDIIFFYLNYDDTTMFLK